MTLPQDDFAGAFDQQDGIQTGLLAFCLTDAQEILLAKNFECISADVSLLSTNTDEILKLLEPRTGAPGIYFWLMQVEEKRYKIYIGKARCLKRRMCDYIGSFQPHAANDFKIQIFQRWALRQFKAAKFTLYFSSCAADECYRLEKTAIGQFDPLLNRKALSTEAAKKALAEAFETFYCQGFERLLWRPNI